MVWETLPQSGVRTDKGTTFINQDIVSGIIALKKNNFAWSSNIRITITASDNLNIQYVFSIHRKNKNINISH